MTTYIDALETVREMLVDACLELDKEQQRQENYHNEYLDSETFNEIQIAQKIIDSQSYEVKLRRFKVDILKSILEDAFQLEYDEIEELCKLSIIEE